MKVKSKGLLVGSCSKRMRNRNKNPEQKLAKGGKVRLRKAEATSVDRESKNLFLNGCVKKGELDPDPDSQTTGHQVRKIPLKSPKNMAQNS
jgi:hypothetical protein